MTSKKISIVSPFAEAVFPYLNTPDTAFDEKGKFHTRLRLDPGIESHALFLGLIYRAGKEAKVDESNLPIKDEVDQNKSATGKKLVKFASSYPPKLFDARNQPLAEGMRIGRGSIIRISAAINVYNVGNRSGLNLYLKAVQVQKLVDALGGSAEAYGFAPTEPEEPPEAAPAAKGAGAAPEAPADFFKESEELPF